MVGSFYLCTIYVNYGQAITVAAPSAVLDADLPELSTHQYPEVFNGTDAAHPAARSWQSAVDAPDAVSTTTVPAPAAVDAPWTIVLMPVVVLAQTPSYELLFES